MPSIVIAVVAAAVLAVAAPAIAQTSAKDVGQKAAETGEAIKDYTVEKKDEAVAHAKKLARELDGKLKELEAQAAKQTGEAKAKSQQMIKDLKAKRAKASGKLNELGKASKASWEEAKKGFVDAYRDLAMGYDRAVSEFKK
jgi:hypothetical protein